MSYENRLPDELNNNGKTFEKNRDFKEARLPLCLAGILLAEMTFDKLFTPVRMSSSTLLGFPPLTALNVSSSKMY